MLSRFVSDEYQILRFFVIQKINMFFTVFIFLTSLIILFFSFSFLIYRRARGNQKEIFFLLVRTD